MTISNTPVKKFTDLLTLIKEIRPDSADNLSKIGAFYARHLVEDFGPYDFDEYRKFVEKQLAYDTRPITIAVIMSWGRDYAEMKQRTFTPEQAKLRDNFYANRD